MGRPHVEGRDRSTARIRAIVTTRALFLVALAVTPAHGLAPHPIAFSVDGSPSAEFVEVEGKVYEVEWDGQALSMEEVPVIPPPKSGDVIRMTVNYRAGEHAVVAWEIYWNEEAREWRAVVNEDEFKLYRMPEGNRFQIFAQEWMD